jgi:hypothetical protein
MPGNAVAMKLGACFAYITRRWSHGSSRPSSSTGRVRAGSKEYVTASSSLASIPACFRHHRTDSSGSSQVENGTGRLPCLRRLKRSSSAAATVLRR